MEIAAARCDALALLYMLADTGVPPACRLALQSAVSGTWDSPSQNFSIRERAVKIRDLETERGFTRGVKESEEVSQAEETWAESAQDWAAYDAQTESLADDAVYYVCNLQIL
jgi:hypothetical protein